MDKLYFINNGENFPYFPVHFPFFVLSPVKSRYIEQLIKVPELSENSTESDPFEACLPIIHLSPNFTKLCQRFPELGMCVAITDIKLSRRTKVVRKNPAMKPYGEKKTSTNNLITIFLSPCCSYAIFFLSRKSNLRGSEFDLLHLT